MASGLTWYFWASIGLFVLVLLARVGAGAALVFFNERAGAANEEMASLKAKWPKQLEEQILALPPRLANIETLLGSHIYGSSVFQFLRANTLKEVAIANLRVEVKTGVLDINAMARDYDALAQQLVWLKSLPLVQTVGVSGISLGEGGVVKFKLIIKVSPRLFTSQK